MYSQRFTVAAIFNANLVECSRSLFLGQIALPFFTQTSLLASLSGVAYNNYDPIVSEPIVTESFKFVRFRVTVNNFVCWHPDCAIEITDNQSVDRVLERYCMTV